MSNGNQNWPPPPTKASIKKEKKVVAKEFHPDSTTGLPEEERQERESVFKKEMSEIEDTEKWLANDPDDEEGTALTVPNASPVPAAHESAVSEKVSLPAVITREGAGSVMVQKDVVPSEDIPPLGILTPVEQDDQERRERVLRRLRKEAAGEPEVLNTIHVQESSSDALPEEEETLPSPEEESPVNDQHEVEPTLESREPFAETVSASDAEQRSGTSAGTPAHDEHPKKKKGLLGALRAGYNLGMNVSALIWFGVSKLAKWAYDLFLKVFDQRKSKGGGNQGHEKHEEKPAAGGHEAHAGGH